MLCLVLLLMAPLQEGIISEELSTVTLGDRFREAISLYNSVERSNAQTIFEEIVSSLEAQPTVSPDERFFLYESLKYLGAMNFPNGSAEYFRKLLLLNPNYDMTDSDLSPKIIAIFQQERDRTIGTLRVSVRESSERLPLGGATLWIGDKELGPVVGQSDFGIMQGTHRVEVRCSNYDTFAADVEILSGQVVDLDAVLDRNASEMVLVTIPGSVKVTVNDIERGTSSDPIPFEYHDLLKRMDIPLEQAGAITINQLKPGRYTIQFDKPCYKSWTGVHEIDRNKRWLVRPAELEPAAAFLSINTPGEATGIVFLDKERAGFLPLDKHSICPGEYTVRVQFSDGEYVKQIKVVENQELTLSAEPLPSIAWFGIETNEGETAPPEINSWLSGLNSWNVLSLDANNPTEVPVNPFAILFNGNKMTDNGRVGLTREVKADLFMAARIVRKKVVIRYLEVAAWTPLSQAVKVYSFDLRELEKFQKLLGHMDEMPPLVASWLGAHVANLEGLPGCRVLSVHPQGPLAGQAAAGETLQQLNGNPIRTPSELYNLPIGSPARVDIGGRSLTVEPVATIAEVPFDPTTYCAQAYLAKFEKFAKYHSNAMIRESAAFNQARYQLLLGDYKEAFDIFSTLTLSEGPGINQGTLYFYQGLCFRRLKLPAEALSAFRKVLTVPEATLFNAYGPKAAHWAEAELNVLSP